MSQVLHENTILQPAAPARTLHVAHVVLSMDVGGLERVVLDLIAQGRQLDQRITLVCMERPGMLADDAEALGAKIICMNKQPGVQLGMIRQMKRMFAEIKPDVVHTHQIGALFYGGTAAKRAGVPVIVHTEHGKHYSGRWRVRVLARFASRHAKKFFCVSEDLAADVKRHGVVSHAKVQVLHNGIDIARFEAPEEPGLRRYLNIPAGAPVVGTVGRLCQIKRQDVLLRAFAAVRKTIGDAHLLLVGDGPARLALHQLARDLGIEAATHFAGYQARPEQFLPLMNVFALTSDSEGMPLAVLEAWAAGVPVTASAVGGLPRMIDPGRTGLLFPSGDDAAAAAAIASLLGDPARARKIADEAGSLVRESYSLQRMAQEYQRYYLQLLSETAQRP